MARLTCFVVVGSFKSMIESAWFCIGGLILVGVGCWSHWVSLVVPIGSDHVSVVY